MSAPRPDKVLLVHPLGYAPELARRDISRLTNVTPPIGLLGIAAWLDRHGFRTDVLDGYARPMSDRAFIACLQRERPAWVGFSCTTSIFNDGIRLAGLVRATLPESRIVFGGTHVSALKETILQRFPVVDYVVVGEGEETLRELVGSGGGAAVAGVRGVVYRGATGAPVFTGCRDLGSLDLDRLPFPAYEKLADFPRAYRLPPFSYPAAPHSTCITSRGCPYACRYCDRSVFRRSFRYQSAAYVYEHLRLLRRQYGLRHVVFQDDQFTYDRGRIEDLCRLLIDRPLGLTFACALRAEHTDEALLRDLKAAGCWMASLGIETGDAELLAQHRQNPDLDFLAGRIRLLKRVGIRVKGLLMMGLPGESEASIQRSMRYVLSLPLDELSLAKFTPFPGSPLYEGIAELGAFEENWDRMDCMHFQFVPKGLTKERLEALYSEFYRTYYKRPASIRKFVSMIWESPHSYRQILRHAPAFLRFALSGDRLSGSKGRSPV